jgi:sulfite exporter TauE/SafE
MSGIPLMFNCSTGFLQIGAAHGCVPANTQVIHYMSFALAAVEPLRGAVRVVNFGPGTMEGLLVDKMLAPVALRL